MRIRLAAGLVLAFCLSVFAQGASIDIPYQKFMLKNGLTLIVHEDHKAPIVAVNLWYHVGSKNEKTGKTGFAHLFEHLMFAGSEHNQRRYLEVLEPLGATDLNGTTNNDRTNFFETVPTSALDTTLWLESDRMGHLLGAIDQKTLDLQRVRGCSMEMGTRTETRSPGPEPRRALRSSRARIWSSSMTPGSTPTTQR